MNAGGITIRVAVTWEMCGFVDIDAISIEEAMQNFKKTVTTSSFPTMAFMSMAVSSYLLMMWKKWKPWQK